MRRERSMHVVLVVCLISSISAPFLFSEEGYWDSRFRPQGLFNGAVRAVEYDGNNVYVGGDFTLAGGLPCEGLAFWDGQKWNVIPGKLYDGTSTVRVLDIDWYDDRLYVVGNINVFTTGIAVWDGDAWSTLGDGLAGSPSQVVVRSADEIYTVVSKQVWLWDGESWQGLGSKFGDDIESFFILNGEPYVVFSSPYAPGGILGHFAKWNGETWAFVAWQIEDESSQPGDVFAAVVQGTDLIIGGSFETIDDEPYKNIARWDGNSWHSLGTNLEGTVIDVAVFGDAYYALVRSRPDYTVMKFDGTAWQHFADVENGSFIRGTEDRLLFGGISRAIGDVEAFGIAWWDGSAWSSPVEPGLLGLDGPVNDILHIGEDIFVAGEFIRAGDKRVNRISRWDGSGWKKLGGGIEDGVVNVVAEYEGDLLAGGEFSLAGGQAVSNIARWDGAAWSGFDDVLNDPVSAIGADTDGKIVVGMSLDQRNGDSSVLIAKWDGGHWNVIDERECTSGSCRWHLNDLTLYESALYAAVGLERNGLFSGELWWVVGTSPANIPGPWPVQRAPDEGTKKLNVVGNRLYVAGNMTDVQFDNQRISSPGIYAWNGSQVQAFEWLTTDQRNWVGDIAFLGNTMYVGGAFEATDGRYNVARYDGLTWSTVGGGIPALPNDGSLGPWGAVQVRAVETLEDQLIIGGLFRQTGEASSPYFAIWHEENPLWPYTYEEFFDDADEWSPEHEGAWTSSKDGNHSVFQLETAGSSEENALGEYAVFDVVMTQNFIMTCQAKTAENAEIEDADIALLFEFIDENNYGYVDFCRNQEIKVVKVTDGVAQLLATTDAEIGILDDDGYHDFKLARVGGEISAFCDNVAILNTVDDTPRSGKLGIGSLDDRAYFDHVNFGWSDAGDVVPVELISLDAVPEPNGILLQWQTATESNNYGFRIERLMDSGSGWLEIGFVAGQGSTVGQKQYVFRDESTEAGASGRKYRIIQVDLDGRESVYGPIAVAMVPPADFYLGQNYPNPFNSETSIRYGVPARDDATAHITLDIVNLAGQHICRLVDADKAPGFYATSWNGIDESGDFVSTGVYFVVLSSDHNVSTRKLMLVK